MGKNEQIDEQFTKPGYDARLKFIDNFMELARMASVYAVNLDYEAWYQILDQLYLHASAYIKPEHSNEINDLLKKIEQRLYSVNSTFDSQINKQIMNIRLKQNLRDCQHKLLSYGKHLFLPIKDNSVTEFDQEEFFRGSGLS